MAVGQVAPQQKLQGLVYVLHRLATWTFVDNIEFVQPQKPGGIVATRASYTGMEWSQGDRSHRNAFAIVHYQSCFLLL